MPPPARRRPPLVPQQRCPEGVGGLGVVLAQPLRLEARALDQALTLSTMAISSPVRPYRSYTSAWICRSVASICRSYSSLSAGIAAGFFKELSESTCFAPELSSWHTQPPGGQSEAAIWAALREPDDPGQLAIQDRVL